MNHKLTENIKENRINKYIELKKLGICTECCNKDAIPGEIYCLECKTKRNAASKVRREEVAKNRKPKTLYKECKHPVHSSQYKLYRKMKEKGMSAKELSIILSVSAKSVTQWLYHDQIPKRETQMQINEYFNEIIFALNYGEQTNERENLTRGKAINHFDELNQEKINI